MNGLFSLIHAYIENALSKKTTTVYVWFIGCLLLFMSHIHIANILGWNGQPWLTFPLLWQLMDIALLCFELYIAFGLIYRKVKVVVILYTGLFALQIIPFTVFRPYFIEDQRDIDLLNSLLVCEIILMSILAILIILQGQTSLHNEESM